MLRGTRAELRRVVCCGALVFGSLTLVAAPAPAADDPTARQTEIQRELDRLRDEFGETVSDERQALAELAVSRRAEARLAEEAAALDAEIASTQQQLAEAQALLAAAVAEAERLEAAVGAARASLVAAQDDARGQAVAAYVSNDVTAYSPLLFMGIGEPSLVTAGPGYVRAVVDHQRSVVAEFQEQWDRTQDDRDAALAARQQAEVDATLVAQRQAELAAHRAEQAAAQAAADAEVARQRRLVSRVQATKAAEQARIKALERESAEIQAMLAARQSEGSRPDGQLAFPVPGHSVGSLFGQRRHPIFGDLRLHAGIDISAPTGTAVRAAAGGEVVAARGCGGYGTCVIVDHGGGIATLYAHLSAMSVKSGDRVTRGQTIGKVGSTGRATGPHLHFEVRLRGVPANPMPYL